MIRADDENDVTCPFRFPAVQARDRGRVPTKNRRKPMSVKRIYVEKKPEFAVKARTLKETFLN